MNANDLIVYDEEGQEKFRQSFGQEVRWVSCDGSNTAVLLAGSVQAFDAKGRKSAILLFGAMRCACWYPAGALMCSQWVNWIAWIRGINRVGYIVDSGWDGSYVIYCDYGWLMLY